MLGIETNRSTKCGRVELSDDQPFAREPFKTEKSQRASGLVQVFVDGRSISTPVVATIRLTRRDANRYWGFVYFMKLIDRQGPDRLVVAQNLGGGQYRTVSVFADGQVVVDTFEYAARCNPPVRAALIRFVVPHPSGFCSDVRQVWPSIWYPVLYPWLSGALRRPRAERWQPSAVHVASPTRHRRFCDTLLVRHPFETTQCLHLDSETA
jgi:hypothetical protein